MKRFLFALAALVCGLTQAQEPYQVPGFSPFAPAPQMLEVVEDRGDTVVVRHGYGETEVPKNPQRIFATDEAALEILLSLGIQPVGAAYWRDLPVALQKVTKGTTILSAQGGINLEAVLSLSPDLIVGGSYIPDRAFYEQLSRIAPTVVFIDNSHWAFWRQGMRDVARLLDMPEQAEKALRNYDEQVEELRAAIQSHTEGQTLSILLVHSNKVDLANAGVVNGERFEPTFLSAWAYQDLRLTPGPEVEKLGQGGGRIPLSFEYLPDLEADHLALVLPDPDSDEQFQVLTSHPLWDSIPAVQKGNAYRLGLEYGYGYFTNLYFLERAADIITGEGE